MKERAIDRERAVVVHDQATEVPEPRVGAFDDPSLPVAPQRSQEELRSTRNPGWLCGQIDSLPRCRKRLPAPAFAEDGPRDDAALPRSSSASSPRV
jgi:hypothetical protein